MRVLLAVGWYFPDPVGGTEVYVRGLARRLARAGLEVAIAAPRDGGRPERYEHAGIRVFRYPAAVEPTAAELTGLSRPAGFEAWEAILGEVGPDLVDFHSFTRGAGVPHIRAAADSGAAVVLTVHVPSALCMRGTMLRFGRTPCDADLPRRPCAACRLHGLGVARPLARLAGGLPAPIGRLAAQAPGLRVLRGWLGATAAFELHRARLREATSTASRVVAGSRWLVEALRSAGVPAEKLALCAQGVEPGPRHPRRPAGGRLRVGFIGRSDPVKGAHVLVDAVRTSPASPPIEGHLWTSGTSPAAASYREALERRAHRDPRLVFHPAVDDAGAALAALDVLAVPSLWMETGPLVVLEALAAGVPVIGSDLGGIAERVRNGVDGLLVPPGSVTAMAGALAALAREPGRLERLRAGIQPVRTMDEVAAETVARYASLVPATARRPLAWAGSAG